MIIPIRKIFTIVYLILLTILIMTCNLNNIDNKNTAVPVLMPMNVLGVYRTSSNGWGGEKPPFNYAQDWKTDFPDHVKNLARFKSFIDSCGKIGIQCLLVITPESPAYKNTGYFMRYGPTWDNGIAIVNQIKTITDSIPNCHFYDAYNGGNHDYSDNDAYDSDHLSATGAKKFSARVDSVITLF